MMMTPSFKKHQPLWIGGAGLVLLPVVLQAIGLTYDNATVVVLLAMLAAPGTSILRDVYSINRGYEELAERLNSLGAKIEVEQE